MDEAQTILMQFFHDGHAVASSSTTEKFGGVEDSTSTKSRFFNVVHHRLGVDNQCDGRTEL